MKKIIVLPILITAFIAFGQSKDERSIREVLVSQTKAWNNGDLEVFMEGYWKNDSLMFIGKRGISRGWQRTLENYEKGYPDTAAMGKLAYDILLVKKLSDKYYYVVGKWMLKRSAGDLEGYYNLLFEKVNDRWLIIADHSS
ncbi:MAG TPA: hypothetical protein VK588_12820 [Chitinophagaceae bacterium]|nr:hypothetical protein [Chitinophagaceae bacterium]